MRQTLEFTIIVNSYYIYNPITTGDSLTFSMVSITTSIGIALLLILTLAIITPTIILCLLRVSRRKYKFTESTYNKLWGHKNSKDDKVTKTKRDDECDKLTFSNQPLKSYNNYKTRQQVEVNIFGMKLNEQHEESGLAQSQTSIDIETELQGNGEGLYDITATNHTIKKPQNTKKSKDVYSSVMNQLKDTLPTVQSTDAKKSKDVYSSVMNQKTHCQRSKAPTRMLYALCLLPQIIRLPLPMTKTQEAQDLKKEVVMAVRASKPPRAQSHHSLKIPLQNIAE